jgi:hypothetical protein
LNWNKEIIKGPFPIWAVILCSILSGCFFCWLAMGTTPTFGRSTTHLILTFIFGASAYFYLWFLARLAKNPSPWQRQNMRLIISIGGLLNAIVIVWTILGKK